MFGIQGGGSQKEAHFPSGRHELTASPRAGLVNSLSDWFFFFHIKCKNSVIEEAEALCMFFPWLQISQWTQIAFCVWFFRTSNISFPRAMIKPEPGLGTNTEAKAVGCQDFCKYGSFHLPEQSKEAVGSVIWWVKFPRGLQNASKTAQCYRPHI